MTTLRDILRDLIKDAVQRSREGKGIVPSEEQEELLDEYMAIVEERIVG